MDRILISELDKSGLASLPSGWGFFVLGAEGRYLAFSKSGNISRRIKELWQKRVEDRILGELFHQAEYLDYQVFSEPIRALIEEKIAYQEHGSELIADLSQWKSYVYLALDGFKHPFIKIEEQILDDWFYIGPFRSRFWLSDLTDTYARLLKLPQCPGRDYPCERLETGACKAYCMVLQAAEDELAADLLHASKGKAHKELERHDRLLKETYARVENKVLDLIKRERDNYYDDLEFEKADLLDDEIRLLQKYRDWLAFLYVTKDLAFKEKHFEVEAGQIKSYNALGKHFSFPIDRMEYRDNEILALPKNIVDECHIVYDYYKNNHRG